MPFWNVNGNIERLYRDLFCQGSSVQICDGVQAGLDDVAGREEAEDGPLGYVDLRRVNWKSWLNESGEQGIHTWRKIEPGHATRLPNTARHRVGTALTFVLSINIDRDSWMLNSATDMVPTPASHLFVVISKSPREGQRSWSGRTGVLGLGEVGYMVRVQSFSLTCSPSLTKLVSSRTSELFSSPALKIHNGRGQRLREAAYWNSTVTLAVSSLF